MLRHVRYGLSISPAGEAGDPRALAQLAQLAEEAGWDGIFLEDYIVYQGEADTPTYDPWVTLAAMAVATHRVRLGTSVHAGTAGGPGNWRARPSPSTAFGWQADPGRGQR